MRTPSGEIQRRLLAHTSARSGDDHDLAGKIEFLLTFHDAQCFQYWNSTCHFWNDLVKLPRSQQF